MISAASMPEQKSALELNLSCAFCIWVCFLPEWMNRGLFKGMVSFSVRKKITHSNNSVLGVETLCCIMRTLVSPTMMSPVSHS